MSIQSMIGNAASSIGHSVSASLSELSTKVNNAIGVASASVSSLYDGGFVGIDASNITTLTNDVESYVQRLMEISDNFAKSNDISSSLKGEAEEAAQNYISAIASLLDAYCTTYRNFNTMANSAASSFNEGDESNASNISDEAQNILIEAQGIVVDNEPVASTSVGVAAAASVAGITIGPEDCVFGADLTKDDVTDTVPNEQNIVDDNSTSTGSQTSVGSTVPTSSTTEELPTLDGNFTPTENDTTETQENISPENTEANETSTETTDEPIETLDESETLTEPEVNETETVEESQEDIGEPIQNTEEPETQATETVPEETTHETVPEETTPEIVDEATPTESQVVSENDNTQNNSTNTVETSTGNGETLSSSQDVSDTVVSSESTDNRSIDELRDYFGLKDNKYIDNKFAYYQEDLTNTQTEVLSKLDQFGQDNNISQEDLQDWAWMMCRESGLKPDAVSSSGTYTGLGQMSPDAISTYAPSGDYATNIDTQLAAGYAYIMDTYGSIGAAKEHWEQESWY